jgi:predicted alpha/beta hydrolase
MGNLAITHAPAVSPLREGSPDLGLPVRVPALDGRRLAGSYFEPEGAPRGTVLLLSGTGIPKRFYAPFAAHLARRGFGTLTLDYRGIGESRPERWRGFEATKQDWARLDFSGGFDWLEQRLPGVPRLVFGHSVGGQLLGLMARPEAIDGVVTFGTSFGYWRHMEGAYGWMVGGLWYVAIPLLTRLFGYMPTSALGLGEDLPAGVAREWARWGRRRDYFTAELADRPGFASLSAPWLALYASDDPVATPANAEPMLALYPNADTRIETLDPTDHGHRSIGHLSFFRRAKSDLWPRVSDWLLAHS